LQTHHKGYSAACAHKPRQRCRWNVSRQRCRWNVCAMTHAPTPRRRSGAPDTCPLTIERSAPQSAYVVDSPVARRDSGSTCNRETDRVSVRVCDVGWILPCFKSPFENRPAGTTRAGSNNTRVTRTRAYKSNVDLHRRVVLGTDHGVGGGAVHRLTCVRACRHQRELQRGRGRDNVRFHQPKKQARPR
jgi:hypothetical protein